MGKVDYNLRDIEPDELYKLLPYVVRATDPNQSIRTILNAAAEFHNYAIEKLRQMPRLQDPDKCGKFSAADLGEDEDAYREYVTLLYRNELALLSDDEKKYMEALKERLPKSLDARQKEIAFLGMLSDSIGVKTFSRFFVGVLRSWIKTGVLRNHINGTHSSVYLLGRVLGFIDLKVAELWSRYAIKDPAEPKAVRNLHDFAYESDQPPYRPLSGVYGDNDDLIGEYEREDGVGNT